MTPAQRRILQDTINAQASHVSHVRVMEMVAERSGDPEKIVAARKRYDSAVAALNTLRAELEPA